MVMPCKYRIVLEVDTYNFCRQGDITITILSELLNNKQTKI